MKKVSTLMGMILVVFTGVTLIACSSSDSKASDTKTAEAKTETAAPAAPESPWTYDSDTDKMTSKVEYSAVVMATKELDLKAPYDGGVQASLHVVSNDGKLLIYVHISKGQLIAATPTNDGTVLVRFDDDKAESYNVAGPSDYSTETVFISSTQKFLARLKTAKKVLIQADIFDNGAQQMEFNVGGLKFDHGAKPNS